MGGDLLGEPSLRVALVRLVDRLPATPPRPRGRGRPPLYPDRVVLKALVIMVIKCVPRVGPLLAVLAEPTPEMRRRRARLAEWGRFPARRPRERRLRALPATLPAQLGCLGRHLVVVLEPWAAASRVAAVDSTPLRARGGEWHRTHREAEVGPHSTIDSEAGWTTSGWPGRVSGWKRRLAVTVAAEGIPLAAELTPANVADTALAPALLPESPPELRFLLADVASADPALRAAGAGAGLTLVTPRRGPSPPAVGGVEVRRVFPQLRSHAIEHSNGQLSGIFDHGDRVPTRGLVATRRFVLGAVPVDQLVFLHRLARGAHRRVGLKACPRAA
jgi:hypothetical protein